MADPIITTADVGRWNEAYYWGNHTLLYEVIDDTLVRYTDQDPCNWNIAFGWGDHHGLYSLVNHTHTPIDLSGYTIKTTGDIDLVSLLGMLLGSITEHHLSTFLNAKIDESSYGWAAARLELDDAIALYNAGLLTIDANFTRMGEIDGELILQAGQLSYLTGELDTSTINVAATNIRLSVAEGFANEMNARLIAQQEITSSQWTVKIQENYSTGDYYATGFGLIMYPDWITGISVAVDDFYWYNGESYKAKISHVTGLDKPPTNTTYWEFVPYGRKSQFGVLADSFFIQGTGANSAIPFIVDATTGTVGINGQLIVNGPSSLADISPTEYAILTAAEADAAEAIATLEDWASDSKFTVNEKTAMQEGWYQRTAEYLEVKSHAESLSVSTAALVNAFDAWGTYLNGGASWNPPTSYPPSNVSLPFWIQDAQLDVTVTILRSDFVGKASSYFDALGDIKTAIAGKINLNVTAAQNAANAAQGDADDAIGYLTDWASDSMLSPEEKKHLRNGWFVRTAEYLDIKSQASFLSLSTTTLVSTFDAWGTYLNNGSAWDAPTAYTTSDSSLPLWLRTSSSLTSTSIVRTTFVSKAAAYFDALVALKNSIATTLNTNITDAAGTANWTMVNGRPTDLATLDNTASVKLMGIASGADVTQNVLNAGAAIDYAKVNGSTLVAGGYIRTTLIDVDTLISDEVITGNLTFAGLYSILDFTGLYGRVQFGSAYLSGLSGSGGSFVAGSNRIDMYASSTGIDIESNYTGGNVVLDCGAYSSDTAGVIDFKTSGTSRVFIKPTGMYPRYNNAAYLGWSANLWQAVYATGYYDNGGGYNDTLDDLAILAEFKPKKELVKDLNGNSVEVEMIDPKNNSNFLDLNSVPVWMTNKHEVEDKLKRDNGDLLTQDDIAEFIADENEAGWMLCRNISAFNDLTNGAVRQLDIEMKELVELMSSRITSLENEIRQMKQLNPVLK